MNTLLLSHYRYLTRHRLQAALAILGIALGVTVVTAIDLTNASAHHSFTLAYQQVSGSATHKILGGSRGISETFYRRLRFELLPHYAGVAAAPVLQAHVTLNPSFHPPAQHKPSPQIFQLVAIDPVAEAPFQRPLSTLTALSPLSPEEMTRERIARLMLEPNSALLSRMTAEQLEISVGEQLTVESNGKLHSLDIIELLGDADDASLSHLLMMDIGNAQRLFGHAGFFSHIDLKVDSDQAAAFFSQLENILPADAQVESTGAASRRSAAMTESFQLNLQALSLLSLLVGLFLIYNTLNSFVLQRRDLFGRLRALGVSRGQLYRAILSEALLLGLIGTAIGLPCAWCLTKYLLLLSNQTISDLYYPVTVTQLLVSPAVLLKGCALGIGATLLAAWAPARQAACVSARQQLQRIEQEQSFLQHQPLAYGGTLILLLTGIGFIHFSATGIVGGFIAIFCLLLAAALLLPSLLLVLIKLFTAIPNYIATSLIARPLSVPLNMIMALRDTGRNLSRTGIAAMALLIAMATTNGIGIMIESFRGTVAVWLENRLNADIYVRPVKTSQVHQGQFIAPEVYAQLQNNPDIAELSRYLDFPVTLGDHTAELIATDLPSRGRQGYHFLSQFPVQNREQNEEQKSTAIWQAFDQGQLLISEPLANKLDLGVGDTLPLFTDRGPQDFTIAGIYYDYGSEHGRMLIQRSHFLRYWDKPGVETIGIYLKQGLNPDLTKKTAIDRNAFSLVLENQLQNPTPLRLRNSRDVLSLGMGIFDRTFVITDVLRLLALIIAMIGILAALTTLQLERRQELLTLRAIGFTRSQIARQLMIQATALGALVGLLAIPLGQALAWLLINVVNLRAFGWTMALQPQWGNSLENLVLASLAALTASLYPAWQSTRQQHLTQNA